MERYLSLSGKPQLSVSFWRLRLLNRFPLIFLNSASDIYLPDCPIEVQPLTSRGERNYWSRGLSSVARTYTFVIFVMLPTEVFCYCYKAILWTCFCHAGSLNLLALPSGACIGLLLNMPKPLLLFSQDSNGTGNPGSSSSSF